MFLGHGKTFPNGFENFQQMYDLDNIAKTVIGAPDNPVRLRKSYKDYMRDLSMRIDPAKYPAGSLANTISNPPPNQSIAEIQPETLRFAFTFGSAQLGPSFDASELGFEFDGGDDDSRRKRRRKSESTDNLAKRIRQ